VLQATRSILTKRCRGDEVVEERLKLTELGLSNERGSSAGFAGAILVWGEAVRSTP
jgi:hypothetical protein